MSGDHTYTRYNRKLKNNAQSLRKNSTRQENHLWYDFLSTYPIKFYRQRVVVNYILDFYCPKIKLAIELDGSQHYDNESKVYDSKRTTELNKLGVKVIRFDNISISTHFDAICMEIDRLVKEMVK